MPALDIQIVSEALIGLGALPIDSFEDGTAEADVAARLYPSVRDSVLSIHPWTFASAETVLTRLAVQPLANYSFAYALPAGFLRALSVGDKDNQTSKGVDYRIQESRLHCSASAPLLAYIFRPDESGFPPYFRSALIAKLQAAFALPVTENTARATTLIQLAEKALVEAKTTDSQSQPPSRFEDYTLTAVRA